MFLLIIRRKGAVTCNQVLIVKSDISESDQSFHITFPHAITNFFIYE